VKQIAALIRNASAAALGMAAVACATQAAAEVRFSLQEGGVSRMVTLGGSCNRCELSGRKLSGATFTGATFTRLS
jgi:hypothetical protein